MTEEVSMKRVLAPARGALRRGGRGVSACCRCRLGDRGIDHIECDTPRLREQDDRRVEVGE
jgi:hypothetical protein